MASKQTIHQCRGSGEHWSCFGSVLQEFGEAASNKSIVDSCIVDNSPKRPFLRGQSASSSCFENVFAIPFKLALFSSITDKPVKQAACICVQCWSQFLHSDFEKVHVQRLCCPDLSLSSLSLSLSLGRCVLLGLSFDVIFLGRTVDSCAARRCCC